MGLASREFNSTSANVYAGALQHATTEAMIVTFFTNKTRWAKRKKTNILFQAKKVKGKETILRLPRKYFSWHFNIKHH